MVLELWAFLCAPGNLQIGVTSYALPPSDNLLSEARPLQGASLPRTWPVHGACHCNTCTAHNVPHIVAIESEDILDPAVLSVALYFQLASEVENTWKFRSPKLTTRLRARILGCSCAVCFDNYLLTGHFWAHSGIDLVGTRVRHTEWMWVGGVVVVIVFFRFRKPSLRRHPTLTDSIMEDVTTLLYELRFMAERVASVLVQMGQRAGSLMWGSGWTGTLPVFGVLMVLAGELMYWRR